MQLCNQTLFYGILVSTLDDFFVNSSFVNYEIRTCMICIVDWLATGVDVSDFMSQCLICNYRSYPANVPRVLHDGNSLLYIEGNFLSRGSIFVDRQSFQFKFRRCMLSCQYMHNVNVFSYFNSQV